MSPSIDDGPSCLLPIRRNRQEDCLLRYVLPSVIRRTESTALLSSRASYNALGAKYSRFARGSVVLPSPAVFSLGSEEVLSLSSSCLLASLGNSSPSSPSLRSFDSSPRLTARPHPRPNRPPTTQPPRTNSRHYSPPSTGRPLPPSLPT